MVPEPAAWAVVGAGMCRTPGPEVPVLGDLHRPRIGAPPGPADRRVHQPAQAGGVPAAEGQDSHGRARSARRTSSV